MLSDCVAKEFYEVHHLLDSGEHRCVSRCRMWLTPRRWRYHKLRIFFVLSDCVVKGFYEVHRLLGWSIVVRPGVVCG